MQNYGMNGYYNPYNQQRFTPLKIYSVSNIMEATATPVENLDPIFFFNRSENVIYKKQIDGTGAAPIQVYKLSVVEQPTNETKQSNPYENDFKTINESINILSNKLDKLINPLPPEEFEDINEKKGKR
jgi:hypothetical protein